MYWARCWRGGYSFETTVVCFRLFCMFLFLFPHMSLHVSWMAIRISNPQKSFLVFPYFSLVFHRDSCIKDALPSTIDSPIKWLDRCGKSAHSTSKKVGHRNFLLVLKVFFALGGDLQIPARISLKPNLLIDVDQFIIPLTWTCPHWKTYSPKWCTFCFDTLTGPEFVRGNTKAGSTKKNIYIGMLFESWK